MSRFVSCILKKQEETDGQLGHCPKKSIPKDAQADVPRKDKRGVNRISDALQFGRLWYAEPNAMATPSSYSRSNDVVIRVYDETGNVIETQEHKGEFKEW
jgi:hypothetical protein